ncbi:hypothetical protein PACTADRAFT_82805 [Pachysolen tannophilus NRRL Y-2460]|uniref:Actin cytoskeleton-regulatory complex protein SLA1 n=1 Tax=Pachysolen tannophilus NRRL Y-2460 TaxID=669874 RepID=A0A1E4TNZ6_PACTA|nr:hypothetical protein PACTADRAFT_82805 [Pachysolen tannophilus NRRL Y-2460]
MSIFLGVYRALYDYGAQNEEELSIAENDILYLLEKSDVDDWWKVKKSDDSAGLVPKTYIEVCTPINRATALYDYDKQTEEEISFKEGAVFDVYDTSDADWILVGLNNVEFGFVPSNYIELGNGGSAGGSGSAGGMSATPGSAAAAAATASVLQQRQYGSVEEANKILPPPQRQQRDAVAPVPVMSEDEAVPPAKPSRPGRDIQREDNAYQHKYEDEGGEEGEEEEAPPAKPSRPRSSTLQSSATSNDGYYDEPANDLEFSKDDFFTWKVQEIDGRKKIKSTLAIGHSAVYLSPEVSTGETPRRWEIKNLIEVKKEKKHVFFEFKKPVYTNIELHAGTEDAASAIVSVVGDIKGAISMKGLKEIKAASIAPTENGYKTGRIIFDFEAASDDELTVKENDTVYIINDRKSRDWWVVANIETGEEGLIPSNYVEITKSAMPPSNLFSKFSNRIANPHKKKTKKKEKERRKELEEDSRVRAKDRRDKRDREMRDRDEREVIRKQDDKERARREKKSGSSTKEDKSKPNPHRVRTWIDSTGTFKVEAEFLGCVDGKIHLHKTNGVKIAVAAPKLSVEDLEYVERLTGMSLENYKPKAKEQANGKTKISKDDSTGVYPRTITKKSTGREPEYDWFEFFLNCGVDVNNCQRYTLNFNREQMDENILEDITPSLLRTLGLKEGDILRVMKFLDNKFDRKKNEPASQEGTQGGLFSESHGALKTDRGALSSDSQIDLSQLPSIGKNSTEQLQKTNGNGKFEDDAWAVKPAAQTGSQSSLLQPAQQPSRPSSVPTQNLTGSISDLVNLKPIDALNSNNNNNNSTGVQNPVPLKPTAPALQPAKTGADLAAQMNLVPQQTSGTMAAQRTGASMFLSAQPTGFVPIGFIPIQQTGGYLQDQRTGGLVAVRTGGTTIGASSVTGLINPVTTGGFGTVQTTFGTSTNPSLPLQQTGQLPQLTGGAGMMPQTSFGTTSSLPLQQTGFVPQTSFGQMLVQKTGGNMVMPQTSFGNNVNPYPLAQPTGSFPQNNFNNPGPTTTFSSQPTGFIPQNTFTNSALSLPSQPTGFMQQNTFGSNNSYLPNQQTNSLASNSFVGGNMFQQNGFNNQNLQQQQTSINNLSSMFQNTGISSNPTASFGQQPTFNTTFGQGGANPLQAQPTGFGFGNAPSTSFGVQEPLQAQKTGRANLANATPDNPFGF